jgi:hypothetical protein
VAASRGKPVPVCATGGRRRNASGHANDDRLQVRPSVDLLVAAVVFDWYGSLNSGRIRYAANQVAHWGISTALDIPCTRWPPRETPNLQYQLHTRPHMLIATVFSSPAMTLSTGLGRSHSSQTAQIPSFPCDSYIRCAQSDACCSAALLMRSLSCACVTGSVHTPHNVWRER